ncbi:MAG: hypothetical protein M3362_00060 [Acidobacteriota bacterium]|nr:hypothetical protein [Acidobacteriota bacterium]
MSETVWPKMARKALQGDALQSKRCPPKLEGVINLVNMFPPGVKFPILNARSRLTRFEGEKAEWTRRARFDLYECLKVAPDNFLQFIYGDLSFQTYSSFEPYSPALFKKTTEAIKRYEDFAQLRTKLLRLIRFVKSLELQRRSNSPHVNVPLPLLFSPILDEHGFIQVGGDILIEALRDVKANLIRECAVCKRIFWAKRKDQQCCEPKTCGNVRRVHKSRRLAKERAAEYKANRILKRK